MTVRRAVQRVAALLLGVAALLGVTSPAAGAATGGPVVVLIAVPGLQWSDVANMPTLAHFVQGAAVGELSTKTAGGVTRCAAGELAVGAGNRTSDSIANGNCPRGSGLSPVISQLDWLTLSRSNHASKYRTTLGLLGSSLQAGKIATIAVGGDATPLLANTNGSVTDSVQRLDGIGSPEDSGYRGAVIALLDPGMYYLLPTSDRPTAARGVDEQLAAQLRAVPAGATVMIAGISDIATGLAHLHFFAVSGPGWQHTELRSSAAGKAPFVQLIDIAPTILAAVHLSIPGVMVGRPMQQSGSTVPAISKYVDDDRHAYNQRTLGQRTFLSLGVAVIVLMLLLLLPVRGARVGALWLARLLAPAPMLAFVGNAFPWWRWPQPVYAVIVVGMCAAVAVVTTLAARRSRVYAAIVPLAAVLIALVCDQLTGAHLQFSAPMGDNPIVAGRFSGVGNLDFAEIATAAVLLAGLVAAKVGGKRGLLVAGAILLVAIIVDGAPPLGDDIGGVFALVPGAIVVLALSMNARITWRRAVLAGVATLLVAVGVALADYSRPATSQSHVGRFVGQVLHGGAGTEIHRKLDASLSTFGATVGTFVVVVAIAGAIAAWPRIMAALRSLPGLMPAAVAATVTAVLGVALNDSGIPIAAMATIVGVSAIFGALGGADQASRAGGRH
ncbi:MAG TPA: hypothetical protein VHB18_04100 [Mycobacteriales bacterium]|nr:hypothetical protein [Mycobacteriales bacterium]